MSFPSLTGTRKAGNTNPPARDMNGYAILAVIMQSKMRNTAADPLCRFSPD
ncbi:hypothetical protein HY947_02295 [Candidatus Gottesmanbacteria bacterium]|nr:hypothetical protein [Candidatus Gottesmanbacteria bacterium]